MKTNTTERKILTRTKVLLHEVLKSPYQIDHINLIPTTAFSLESRRQMFAKRGKRFAYPSEITSDNEKLGAVSCNWHGIRSLHHNPGVYGPIGAGGSHT